MPPVLLDELREKLRTVGTEVAVLGFWSRLQSTAYGLALCRTDVEPHGVLLPYGRCERLVEDDGSGLSDPTPLEMFDRNRGARDGRRVGKPADSIWTPR